MTDLSDITDQIASQLHGMADDEERTFGVFGMDTGEIFLKAPDGRHYRLAVNEVPAADVSFIGDEDWTR